MEYDYLYREIDLAQPSDSPKNMKLFASQLSEFVCPSDSSSAVQGSVQTNYFAVVGPGTTWSGDKPRKLSDFGIDASRTIILVEVANSGVARAEPRDLELDKQGNSVGGPKAIAISSHHGDSEDFFFVYNRPNGPAWRWPTAVCFLPPAALLPENLPKLLRIGGCKRADLDGLEASLVETRPKCATPPLAVWLLSVAALMTKAVVARPLHGKDWSARSRRAGVIKTDTPTPRPPAAPRAER